MIRLGRRRVTFAALTTDGAVEHGPLPPQLPNEIWREIVLYLEFWQLVADASSSGGRAG